MKEHFHFYINYDAFFVQAHMHKVFWWHFLCTYTHFLLHSMGPKVSLITIGSGINYGNIMCYEIPHIIKIGSPN